ncbi:hypothetical protein [Streptomyces triticiradicis]|uniref:Lactococcin 972 family bacteriocin n=1 Tax=Streptomyces triticiradicis TaxID=2651189 RepID=A0A7J5D5D2_9ACTN|nr:hypothetical protein [Streptomyces triticiradicis]KAB1979460.1 hypothetical protein F8144_36215 [Streptomyces triticiradicis]
MRIKRVAAVVAAVSALTAATPAFAGEIYASTDGASAWTSPKNGADVKRYANIEDTKADGHPVKAQYSYPFFSESVTTLWEKRGVGNSTRSAYHENQIWRIKACEYINNWPDECSGWSSS